MEMEKRGCIKQHYATVSDFSDPAHTASCIDRDQMPFAQTKQMAACRARTVAFRTYGHDDFLHISSCSKRGISTGASVAITTAETPIATPATAPWISPSMAACAVPMPVGFWSRRPDHGQRDRARRHDPVTMVQALPPRLPWRRPTPPSAPDRRRSAGRVYGNGGGDRLDTDGPNHDWGSPKLTARNTAAKRVASAPHTSPVIAGQKYAMTI